MEAAAEVVAVVLAAAVLALEAEEAHPEVWPHFNFEKKIECSDFSNDSPEILFDRPEILTHYKS